MYFEALDLDGEGRVKKQAMEVQHTHSLVKKQAMEVQQPDASTWEAVTTEFG